MREFRYTKRDPRPDEFRDIDTFWAAARDCFAGDAFGERDTAIMLELQPDDGTRYRFCLARSGSDGNNPNQVVVSMLIPVTGESCGRSVEYDLSGPRPDIWDEPMCNFNPYTGAIMCDVLSAVLWGDEERFYDYKATKPAPLSFPEEVRNPKEPAT